jgi:hypothetical protein
MVSRKLASDQHTRSETSRANNNARTNRYRFTALKLHTRSEVSIYRNLGHYRSAHPTARRKVMQNPQIGEQFDSAESRASEFPSGFVDRGIFENEGSAAVLQDTLVEVAVVKPRLVHHKSFISYGPVSQYFHSLRIPQYA